MAGLKEPHLQEWVDHIERLEWSVMILDSDWRLAWVSPELRAFIDAGEHADLGLGLHVAEAFLQDEWLRTVHPGSQMELFIELAPFFLDDFARRGRNPADILPEQFLPLIDQVEVREAPSIWSTSFMYVDPSGTEDLPAYRVNGCVVKLNGDDGSILGWLIIFFMGVRPNLLTLLARGDQEMYERMARLVEPGPHAAAILFCDLYRSGNLSRRLPSAAYFKLVRSLWTGIDSAVAGETGIVGKHAGDGASAFFLVDDLGSPSQAAAAAARSARRIHDVSEEVFNEALESDCQMRIGLHWGGGLYMGQLVPGGRLDVTALGDEVNEAARIQEAAGAGETLASKQLLEQLTDEDAASVGLDLEKIMYEPFSNREGVSEKALRDAGNLAVTTLDSHDLSGLYASRRAGERSRDEE